MGSRKISIQVGKGKGAKHRKRGSSSFAGRFHGQDERGLESLALAETRKVAEGGDAASQCLMAKACLQGAGCARDAQAGAAWYRKAAEQGSAEGWFGLFSCAIQGLGMPKDEAEAFRACGRAAELGHLDAMANMGLLMLNGTGCQADPARAREWLEKAGDVSPVGICPNDGYGWCECDACRALDTEEDRQKGTVNGRIADFVKFIC
ncbi:MAG: SEL1-like repeat protein, partial [Desulfovibrio sp.]|nr:SEL1-like repeat protein [Desulfovibrio sp.]